MSEPKCNCYFMERRAVERRDIPNKHDRQPSCSYPGRYIAIVQWSKNSPRTGTVWCSYYKWCPLCGQKAQE
jgi:hypothetical protein